MAGNPAERPSAPAIDIADDSFIAVPRAQVAAIIAESSRWVQWWPDLTVTVYQDRGADGMRWLVSGEFVGSSEIWLEAHTHGVVLHYYLRVDPADPRGQVRVLPESPRGRRHLEAVRRTHTVRWKRTVWALKDELETRTN